MQYGELIDFLQNVGKDPSRLIFEDELTGLHNRRFLHSYFEHKVRWDSEDSFPLSLLIMDLDLFKSINDTYGHDAGDEALVFLAGLLKEVSGETGYPIRFGGDEFMVLLPKTELATAVDVAHRLRQLTKERTLELTNGRGELSLSLSIGVAAARGDATSGRDLIRIADTALYTSKKLGRDRVAVASEIDAEKTYRKTALHRIDDADVSGRSRELSAISEALGSLSLGRSKWVVIEGASGMGKSTVIDSVRKSLSGNDALHTVRVSGQRQENFRPYYVIANAILALLSRRPDRGAVVLEGFSEREAHYLGHVLPHLNEGAPRIEEPEDRRREGIFSTLIRLLKELVEGKPLVLIIDDLHYVDEATLMLLRVLFLRQELSLLVCGTVMETVGLGKGDEQPPWTYFSAERGDEISIEKYPLAPLDARDIESHLRMVFPGIELPEGFEVELAEITQGNPLFLGEILRKLVLDQKLKLVGRRWSVERPEEGYLPRSLEEIVSQKIAALDEQGRKLLEEVSTLGEDVPLSIVTGASEVSESEVLEFLDRAEDLGLLRSDFQINDESLRFLSQRVLEIVYGSMDSARREELHGRVGTYQEELYEGRLGPSASILAYHFKLSADEEKARRYDQLRIDLSQKTFNRSEAEHYTGDALDEDEEGPTEEKLPAEALARLPNLFRTLLTTVRSTQLYPPGSKPIVNAHAASFKAVEALFEYTDHISLARAQGVLLANGHKVDVSEFKLLSRSYIELLDRVELESITFRRGLGPDELEHLLAHLGELKPENLDSDHWKRFVAEERLDHLGLQQMRYSEVRKRATARGTEAPRAAGELGPEDVKELPKILRAFLGAAKNIKLYPLGSKPVSVSIEQLHGALGELLTRFAALSFAAPEGALLVNGARVPTAGFDALASNVVAFFDSSELRSITFLPSCSREDIEAFIGALRELPPDLDPSFWREIAREKRIEGIAFNDRRYALSLRTVLDSLGSDPDEDAEDGRSVTAELADEPAQALIEALPHVGKDLLLRGEKELLRKVLRRLFSDYEDQEAAIRERILRGYRELMDSLIEALKHQFAALSADFLLRALNEETDDHLVAELASLLHQMTSTVLQFADYGLASRIFSELRGRQRALLHTTTTGRGLAVLNRKLDTATAALLMEELQSKVPARQENAAQVLESLGKPAISLLIEVVKQEKDFRTRQLAAGLLAKMGPEAAERIKREVVLEVTSEQRFRILEVIDTVTRDLKTELAFCLSDVNPKVRRAAFRLTERLNDKQVLELLVDFARHEDIGVAKGAIRSLANLQSLHSVGALISTLEVTKDPERAIACTRALAQLGDGVAVPVLEDVLTARKFPILGSKRWDDQVRATAAFALAQIGGDRARRVLEKVADDPDPRIRQIAAAGTRDDAAPKPRGGESGAKAASEDQGVA